MPLQLTLRISHYLYLVIFAVRLTAATVSSAQDLDNLLSGNWLWTGNNASEQSTLRITQQSPQAIRFDFTGKAGMSQGSLSGTAFRSGQSDFQGVIQSTCQILISPQKSRLRVRTENCSHLLDGHLAFDGSYELRQQKVPAKKTDQVPAPLPGEPTEETFPGDTTSSPMFAGNRPWEESPSPQVTPETPQNRRIESRAPYHFAPTPSYIPRSTTSETPLSRGTKQENPLVIVVLLGTLIYLLVIIHGANKGEHLIFSSGTDLMISFLAPLSLFFAFQNGWVALAILLALAGNAHHAVKINGSISSGLIVTPARITLSLLFPLLILAMFSSLGHAKRDGRTTTGFSKPSLLPFMLISAGMYYLYQLVVTNPLAAQGQKPGDQFSSDENRQQQHGSSYQQKARWEDNREEKRAEQPRKPSKPCPYEILGVSRSASAQEIKDAFMQKIKANHPDKIAQMDPELRKLAHERTILIKDAFEAIGG